MAGPVQATNQTISCLQLLAASPSGDADRTLLLLVVSLISYIPHIGSSPAESVHVSSCAHVHACVHDSLHAGLC